MGEWVQLKKQIKKKRVRKIKQTNNPRTNGIKKRANQIG
jgi:hypothetical protein